VVTIRTTSFNTEAVQRPHTVYLCILQDGPSKHSSLPCATVKDSLYKFDGHNGAASKVPIMHMNIAEVQVEQTGSSPKSYFSLPVATFLPLATSLSH